MRILGTVSALHGETAAITCGSHGDVTLLLKPDSHLQMGKVFEIVGKVTQLDGGQVFPLSPAPGFSDVDWRIRRDLESEFWDQRTGGAHQTAVRFIIQLYQRFYIY